MGDETNTDQSRPTVAVVIPTYKRKSKLERAVNSVYNQSYTNWKLYVVNDAPTHDVSNLLPDDSRINCIHHTRNQGASAARNTGIQSSEAPYIAFLDDDDTWKSKKLERQIDILHTSPSDFGMLYSGVDIIKKGEVNGTRHPDIEGDVYPKLLYKNFIPSPTPVIRRECFKNVGLFDTELQSSQDIDMWLRIAKEYKMKVISKSLAAFYKSHEDRISKNEYKKINGKRHFINKHKKDLESHPAAMATHLNVLGIYLAYSGQIQEARESFINSIEYNKRQPTTVFYFFLTLLPNSIRSLLFDYHKEIKHK